MKQGSAIRGGEEERTTHAGQSIEIKHECLSGQIERRVEPLCGHEIGALRSEKVEGGVQVEMECWISAYAPT